MTQLTIVAICGSLRRGSYNRIVMEALPALAPAGMTIAEAPGLGDLPLYNADSQQQAGFPAGVTALAEAIRAASGVIVVTPEYNYSIPGVLKNAIDWVSRVPNQPFQNKPVALQSAAIGILGGARAQYHLRQTMVFLDALVFNKPEVFVTMAKSKIDEEARVLTDEPTREVIRQQLAAFAAFIARVGGSPA
jgi:chromate reductase, NAD(P)H dehydrogenase (quinone)